MLKVQVAEIWSEAEGVKALVLKSADASGLPKATAGAHIDVHISPGLVRQYSLCNGPGEYGFYTIAVKKEPASRGGSVLVHECIAKGDILTISEPRNTFPLVEGTGRQLLLAGGIGITPLLSMAKHLTHVGKDYELHYFARSAEAVAFKELFSSRSLLGHGTTHIGVEPEQLPAELAMVLKNFGPQDHVYMCGPPAFMDLASRVVIERGWQEDGLHLEHFGSQVVQDSTPFVVELSTSGRKISVEPQQTILKALRGAGIEIESSCEQGFCGTCITAVREGIPDHRDEFLSDQEKESGKVIMPCVSRSKTARLILDL